MRLRTAILHTASQLLKGRWPSLPGGSQMQNPSQYKKWQAILGGDPSATPLAFDRESALNASSPAPSSGLAAPQATSSPTPSTSGSTNDWKPDIAQAVLSGIGGMFSGHGIIGGGLAAGIGNLHDQQTIYNQRAQVEHLHAESEKARVETQMEQENLDAIRKMRAGDEPQAATPKSGALLPQVGNPQTVLSAATRAASSVAGVRQTPQGPMAVNSAGQPIMNPNDLFLAAQRYIRSGVPGYQSAGEKLMSLYETIITKGAVTDQSGNIIPMPGSAETEARAAGMKSGAEAEAQAPYKILESAAGQGGRPIAINPNQVVTTGADVNPTLKTANEWALNRIQGANQPGQTPQTQQPTQGPSGASQLPLGQSEFAPKLIHNPDGSVTSSVTPATEKMQQDAANRYEKAADAYSAAQDIKSRLGIMRQDADELNKNNWSTTGAGNETRLHFAKAINGISAVLGMQPAFDPKTIGSWESLNKQTRQMGFELARTLGSREAQMIVQQATSSVPNAENTPTGFRLVSSAIEQQVQRQADYYEYATNYLKTHGGDTIGAEISFNRLHPPTEYANRAVANGIVDPRDRKALVENQNNPKAIDAINRKYGNGIAQTILGGQQ